MIAGLIIFIALFGSVGLSLLLAGMIYGGRK